MELQVFLIEALKERFKANATVKAIKEEIESIAEKKTFEKYKSKILINDGMEFELIGVRASFYTHDSIVKLNDVCISLAFFCKSKLPKEKKEKLERVKERYKKEGGLEWNNYKTPIWKEIHFYVELENILSGNINLLIE